MTEFDPDARLELMAAQVETILRHLNRDGLLRRLHHRWKFDFLKRSGRERLRFFRFAVRWIARKVAARAAAWGCHFLGRQASDANRLCVAAVCNGGLGDMLIYAAFLDRFYRECGAPIIDVVPHPLRVKDAEFAFHRSPSVRRIVPHADLAPATTPYDVVLKVADLASYEYIRADRVDRLAPALSARLQNAQRMQEKYRNFIVHQPLLDGLFATLATQQGLRRLDVLGQMAETFPSRRSIPFCCALRPEAYARADALVDLHGAPFVTVHNGWDNVAYLHSAQVTKSWPDGHWARCVAGLKQQLPQVRIVQLGADTSRPIPGVDLCLVKQTSLHEAAWILKHALLHIDADSGLVHIARSRLHHHELGPANFGPTNDKFFHYPANLRALRSRPPRVRRLQWWTTPDWMRHCPRGLSEPVCMKSIEPEDVVCAAARHLRSQPAFSVAAETIRLGSNLPVDAALLAWQAGQAPCREARSGLARRPEALDRVNYRDSGRKVTALLLFPTIPALSAADESPVTPLDFGSYLNIPAENESFDVVIYASVIDRIFLLYGAPTEEALRILADGGILVLTFTGLADVPSRRRVVDALHRLGVRCDDGLASAGTLVLRKIKSNQIVAGGRGAAA